MPIKKKLTTATPTTTATPKKPNKVAAKKPATPPPPKKPPSKKPAPQAARKRVVLGPFPDPAAYPGAHDAVPSVSGQVWKLDVKFSSGGNNSFHFSFEEPSDKKTGSWVWRQRGGALIFETNSGSARYIGRLTGETGSGEGLNEGGTTWTWTATLETKAPRVEVACRDLSY